MFESKKGKLCVASRHPCFSRARRTTTASIRTTSAWRIPPATRIPCFSSTPTPWVGHPHCTDLKKKKKNLSFHVFVSLIAMLLYLFLDIPIRIRILQNRDRKSRRDSSIHRRDPRFPHVPRTETGGRHEAVSGCNSLFCSSLFSTITPGVFFDGNNAPTQGHEAAKRGIRPSLVMGPSSLHSYFLFTL